MILFDRGQRPRRVPLGDNEMVLTLDKHYDFQRDTQYIQLLQKYGIA